MAWVKRRRFSKKSLVKRARGNLKSSKSNTDSLTQTISFSSPVVLSGDSADIPNWYNPSENKNLKTAQLGVVALNVWDMLSRAPNFKAFQKMYDQVRIDYAAVTLNVTNSTISTANSVTTYDIYTAWDRTGLDSTIIDYRANVAGEVATIDGVYISLGSKITDYNHSKSVLNAFQRWKKSLYIYPKNLQEKSQYVSTGQISEWRDPFNTNGLYYPLSHTITGTGADLNDKKYNAALSYNQFMNNDNPALLMENGKYPFKPTLLIGAFRSGVQNDEGKMNLPLDDTTRILMTADWKVVCTFRGAKGATAIS